MDFLRSNVLRRGASSSGQERDVEQQREAVPVEGPGRIRSRRFPLSRPQLPSVLTAQANSGRGLQRRNTNNSEGDDGPKTPRFSLGLPALPSTRLHLPNLARTWTRGESGPPSPQGGEPEVSSNASPGPSLQRVQTELIPVVVEPQPAYTQRDPNSSNTRQFRGAEPAEMHLADLADRGRRRRRRTSADDPERPTRDDGRPKRFMFCFPWVKSRRVRSQILRCFVSGMFLLTLLSVYLALSITKNINNSEFTILLILIILFTTIFFCHGLIRLCMLVLRPQSAEEQERPRLPEMFGPGGYAIPRRPIRVLLARDEEAAGLESETIKLQPPAYGLWRESVRVDPNRIYWQRNDQPSTIHEGGESSESASRPTTANRPPSYISDDGIDYVVEARPRSMAPVTDVPLPPHPSEVNRTGERPAW